MSNNKPNYFLTPNRHSKKVRRNRQVSCCLICQWLYKAWMQLWTYRLISPQRHKPLKTFTYREIIVGEEKQLCERVLLQLLPKFRDDSLIVKRIDQLRLLLLQMEKKERGKIKFWMCVGSEHYKIQCLTRYHIAIQSEAILCRMVQCSAME